MSQPNLLALALGLGLASSVVAPSAADHHEHGSHAMHAPTSVPPADTRQPVEFPPMLREHTLSNMRDHLLALAEIQAQLSAHRYDAAAAVAEKRLGMSSLHDHGAYEVAKFMPSGMQDAGSAMHRAASRFVLAAQEASVQGDAAKAVGALAEITQACVACHSAYRFK